MDQPKMPTPPIFFPPTVKGFGPPPMVIYPDPVYLTSEQTELINDPLTPIETKLKVMSDNAKANAPILLHHLPPVPGDDHGAELYQINMQNYSVTKPKWDAEQARKEEIVKEIAAEQKAEKKKVDSGFYKDKGRGR